MVEMKVNDSERVLISFDDPGEAFDAIKQLTHQIAGMAGVVSIYMNDEQDSGMAICRYEGTINAIANLMLVIQKSPELGINFVEFVEFMKPYARRWASYDFNSLHGQPAYRQSMDYGPQ